MNKWVFAVVFAVLLWLPRESAAFDPLTEAIKAKVSASGFTLLANITVPTTSASFANVPVGDYLVEGTAWMTDPTVGAKLLSYGSANATVLPSQTIPVAVTLNPSSAAFTAPANLVYGSASPQIVSVAISFTNWPLSLRQAAMDVYVTDFPADPFTVFQYLCTTGQILTEVTARGCSGTLSSTVEIMALAAGSAHIFVIVAGASQNMPDGIALLSNSLPSAP